MIADRFHIHQLASDAVQQIRIDHRWQAIEQENKEIELAKEVLKFLLWLMCLKMEIH